jgi:hypothetical protein
VALQAGLNMFAYADNNPVMNTDPSGLAPTNRIVAIRPISDPLIAANVRLFESQIQRYDSNFRYQKLVPAGQPTYNTQDLQFLQARLNQLKSERSTQINEHLNRANETNNQGLSVAARGWDKHARRPVEHLNH